MTEGKEGKESKVGKESAEQPFVAAIEELGHQYFHDAFDRGTEGTDFFLRIVESDREPDGSRNTQSFVKRLRAVVAGAQAEALLTKQIRHVVRMDSFNDEAHASRNIIRLLRS